MNLEGVSKHVINHYFFCHPSGDPKLSTNIMVL